MKLGANIFLGAVTIAMVVVALVLVMRAAPARDTTGLTDRLSQDQQEWVKGLHSPAGMWCCSNADGIDPEWDMTSDGYRVRYQSEWLPVAPGALITAPNRIGVARAWIGFTSDAKPYVRCFLPGFST